MDQSPDPTPFPPRTKRGVYIEIPESSSDLAGIDHLQRFDLAYRTLVAILYNFVPRSGHPGGSLSMCRILSSLFFCTMDQDPGHPGQPAQDQLVLAAGHKAMGLYAMLALRDEVMRLALPGRLPEDVQSRVRLEDLLGFRRNPQQDTPLFRRFASKALDGHPTPAIPFVALATGPSGVGVGSAVGLALGLADGYGPSGPRVHVIEGEGGMTPGRVSEAMACASASELSNLVMHVDFNQSTIDSDRCCREHDEPGDYVQWDPAELAHLHDFNVIVVPDGFDLARVIRAQRIAGQLDSTQPTCIVYRTVKGWRYGIEGRRSHGAGHGFMSQEYRSVIEPFEKEFEVRFPAPRPATTPEEIEQLYFESLTTVRGGLESRFRTMEVMGQLLEERIMSLTSKNRLPRADGPRLTYFYHDLSSQSSQTPTELTLEPGTSTTLRQQLGSCLGFIRRRSEGAVMASAADLLDSTSVADLAEETDERFFRAHTNPRSRLVSAGGITEDAMAAIASGLSSGGTHLAVASSYAAFIAPLSHIASRCHAIGQDALRHRTGEPPHPFIIVMGHASVLTGEDGPTHADPQALQLYQENFPAGLCTTLTPTEPAEVWPLLAAALAARPAVVAIFVTRPPVSVMDRASLGLPDAREAARGAYRVRSGSGRGPAVVIQGSGVALEFFENVLGELDQEALDLDVVVVTSPELFSHLEPEEQDWIIPPSLARRAMGITDFTLPTLYRFVTSEQGRQASLHPFRDGHYQGSGTGAMVMKQAGLDARAQIDAIRRWTSRVSQGTIHR